MHRRTFLTKTLNRATVAGTIAGVINPFETGRSVDAFYTESGVSEGPESGGLENGRRTLARGMYRLEYDWWIPDHRRFRLRFPVEQSTYRAAADRSWGYLSAFDAARSSRTVARLAGEFASISPLGGGSAPADGADSEFGARLPPRDRLAAAVAFVRSFEYAVDPETKGAPEYHRAPTETLVDGRGDCKDATYLLGGILSQPPFGYRTAMVFVPEHMLVGVRRADLPEDVDAEALPGTEYVPIEATADEPIGELSRDPLLAVYDRGFEFLDCRETAATAGHLLSNPSEIDVLTRSM
ncbi:uncharacterized protein Nmlp_2812 [Natronomonas moolapensis 8.8.11]|uniref:Transglutaminase domain protein n=1 Tax=Natronomonas moolapensis (strain DSM 18674 / CECT 7526 / JCM 14361 / 8.8.11) TaxID=268739 RepID=M1XRU9_NATM8|nr:hypothetical protein [Natronomonas moolapensis]CCQ36963.1 uncharacterized protein Nmlp_2812 [Natronomonas moolapensis 8.8.11]